MPPNKKTKKSVLKDAFSSEHFLRSINLQFDAEFPDRIEHFYPTTKSIGLLKSILGQEKDRAFIVVAPYGSGKSLTATYALHLIENRDQSAEMLSLVGNRLKKIEANLGEFALIRKRGKSKGLVIPLHGYHSNFPESLKASTLQALGRLKLGERAKSLQGLSCSNIEEAIIFLRRLKEIALARKLDSVVILWDEFGRNIEKLLSEGRSSRLNEIQVLAEFASRSQTIPIVVGLFMHQGLLHYANNVPQSIRSEWTKIEGRFKSLQYVDDSKEIYRLISEVVSHQTRKEIIKPGEIEAEAKKAMKLKLFKGFGKKELETLFSNAFPIKPATLYLLPRISARVAQNERTLFSFLYSINLDQAVYPNVLFDYFSNDMRVDTTAGGTYKQWLETQSALSKIKDDEESEIILKTACLLGLGTSGERARAGKGLLEYSLEGLDGKKTPKKAIEQLIERKLLLHRQHNDEVSIWHGTDLDLRSRLIENKNRTRDQFDLVQFLTKEIPPPIWFPIEHNNDFSIRRYFTGEYKCLSEFIQLLEFRGVLNDLPTDIDGKIIYLIPEDAAQIKEAQSIIDEKSASDRLVFVIPQEPLPIHDAAHEIWCLQNMQNDSKLIGMDPLATQEIQQMIDDSWGHLQRLLDRVLKPGLQGPYWYNKGKEFSSASATGLRRSLSKIMNDVYSRTPKINNEVINRKKPTAVMVNARKKLLMALLERSGQKDLGMEGFLPDVSLYRTVLLNTGIYKERQNNIWGYAGSNEINDPGLNATWKELSKFFTKPGHRKSPESLFKKISSPPFGIRAGVIPILFAAGLKAFPSAISLTKENEYITDILPSEIEQLSKYPDRYRISVLDLDEAMLKYLRDFRSLFSGVSNKEVPSTDLIRLCFDALEAWKNQLPQAALTTDEISIRAQKFQKLLKRSYDPVRLLFDGIPEIFDVKSSNNNLISKLKKIKFELEQVATKYENSAIGSLQRVLGIVSTKQEKNGVLAKQWASCFPESFLQKLNDGVAKGLITRMMKDYEEDSGLLESLSSLLVGKSFSRWEDSTVTQFDRELTDVVHRVEEAALASQETFGGNTLASAGLERLILGRIKDLYGRFSAIAGEERANEVLNKIKHGKDFEKLNS